MATRHHQKRFVTNCVNSTAKFIGDMLDSPKCREITRATFKRHVNLAQLAEIDRSLGYERGGLVMANDWAVSYHKSEYRGKPCVFFRWSAIEYIFA